VPNGLRPGPPRCRNWSSGPSPRREPSCRWSRPSRPRGDWGCRSSSRFVRFQRLRRGRPAARGPGLPGSMARRSRCTRARRHRGSCNRRHDRRRRVRRPRRGRPGPGNSPRRRVASVRLARGLVKRDREDKEIIKEKYGNQEQMERDPEIRFRAEMRRRGEIMRWSNAGGFDSGFFSTF